MKVGIPIKDLVGRIINKTKSELYEDLFNDHLSELRYIMDNISNRKVFTKVIELSINEDIHFDIGDEFIIDMKEVIDLKKGDVVTLTIKRG